MDRRKLARRLWLVGGLITAGVMVGTVSYGAVHDDPLPFVVGVLLAFPTSVMFALSSASRESRAGY